MPYMLGLSSENLMENAGEIRAEKTRARMVGVSNTLAGGGREKARPYTTLICALSQTWPTAGGLIARPRASRLARRPHPAGSPRATSSRRLEEGETVRAGQDDGEWVRDDGDAAPPEKVQNALDLLGECIWP